MTGHRPDRDGDHYLRVLDAAWDKTRQHWHDDMTRRFGADYWAPMLEESRSYLGALRKLMDLLNAAERDTEY
jgi:hypothetical protein